jgi:VWFA-related protein
MSRCIGLLVCAFAIVPGIQTVFRAGVDMVPVYVTVTDGSSMPAMGLTKDDFELRVDGKAIPIQTFANSTVDLTVVGIFQSGFRTGAHASPPAGDAVRLAGHAFVEALREGDRGRIGSYGVETILNPHLTNDKSVLRRIVDEEIWVRRGWNGLWGGMLSALASFDEAAARRVLLVFGDGKNSANTAMDGSTTLRIQEESPTSQMVADAALRRDITVYSVALGPGGIGSEMRAVAKQTGGATIELDDSDDVSSSVRTIVDELHHQYVLGFVPVHRDGRRHRIDVQVIRPGLSVRTRSAFLAPAPVVK